MNSCPHTHKRAHTHAHTRSSERMKLRHAAIHSFIFSSLRFNLTYKRDFSSYVLRLLTLPVRKHTQGQTCGLLFFLAFFLFLTEMSLLPLQLMLQNVHGWTGASRAVVRREGSPSSFHGLCRALCVNLFLCRKSVLQIKFDSI